jgi:hypothetical protein
LKKNLGGKDFLDFEFLLEFEAKFSHYLLYPDIIGATIKNTILKPMKFNN